MEARALLDDIRRNVLKNITNEKTMYRYYLNKEDNEGASKGLSESMRLCISRMQAYENMRDYLDEKFLELMEQEK